MRYLNITARPPPAVRPALFELFATGDTIEETRLLDWTLDSNGGPTALYAIDGEVTSFVRRARDIDALSSLDVESIDEDTFYALATIDPTGVPLLQRLLSSLTRPGLVVVTPVVYRDGAVSTGMVGGSAVLQQTIDTFSERIDVEIREVGAVPTLQGPPLSVLSERQRQALEVALDIGYYDRPGEATHEDIARHLECAPSTASEHLKKAEAKLIRSTFDRTRYG